MLHTAVNVVVLYLELAEQQVMEISHEVNDEFIVSPGTTIESNALIDITRIGSHD